MKSSRDSVYHPYHKSSRHRWMSNLERGAQFAPFAALTGHQEMIKETERITETKRIMDQHQLDQLNQKISDISFLIDKHPLLTIQYFVPDTKKSGGSYQKLTSFILKIETCQKVLVMENGVKIKIDHIYDIEIHDM